VRYRVEQQDPLPGMGGRANALPSHADIIVVGGGVIGCSVLYHLAKAGCRSVILMERYTVGSGTTSHSAALLPPLLSSREGTELAKYSHQLYSSLEEETGQATGWRVCGHLNIAASSQRLEALKHSLSIVRGSKIDVELISAAEAQAKWPLLNVEDVQAAVWMPAAARVNPTDVCQALVKGAKSRGVKIFENTPVMRLVTRSGRIVGVETSTGRVTCKVLVNCAGLWARELATTGGASAPMFTCEHFYLLTDKIKGVSADLPLLRDADSRLYVREDVGGLLVGCFEPNPKPINVEDLPKNPLIELDEDWEHFEPMMANAMHRIPALATAGARRLVNGPESFTTDDHPLMGESAEVAGLFFACAMNSAGVLLGGGVGMATAEWTLKGRPSVDLWSHDVRRYARFQNNINALSLRIPEVLSRHHTIAWPGSDYETTRGIRKSPFYACFKERGGILQSKRRVGTRRVLAASWRATFSGPNLWPS
jgi:glycine/D-amino acid oxidase-like deaminating enzyme